MITADPLLAEFYRRQVFVDAAKWICFWLVIILISAVLTFAGITVGIPIALLMFCIFIWNAIQDRSGIRNILFLVGSYFLSGFIARFQFGNGVGGSTNYPAGATASIAYLLLFKEWWLFLRFRREGKNRIVIWCATTIIVLGFIQLVVSEQPLESGRKLFQNLTLNYVFFLLALFVSQREGVRRLLPRVLILLLMCSILDASYGLFQYMNGPPAFEIATFLDLDIGSMIIFGDFVKILSLNGSTYGLFYNLVFFISSLVLFRRRIPRYSVLILTSACLSVVLMLTFSERTTLVMLFICAIVIVTIRLSRGEFKRIFRFSIVILVVSLALVSISVMVLQRIDISSGSKMERLAELASPTEAADIVWRMSLWEEGVSQIWPNLLLGDGFKGEYAYHMEYLNILTSLGAFGFIAWCLLNVSIVKTLWRLVGSLHSESILRNLGIILIGFDFALLAAAIPNNPFIYSSGLIFFLLSGIIHASMNGAANVSTSYFSMDNEI